MGERLAKFDLNRCYAEGRTQRGGSCPDVFPAVLCVRNADLSNRDRSAALASSHGSLATMDIAMQERRLSGSIGNPVGKGILLLDKGGQVATEDLMATEKLRGAPKEADGKLNSINPRTGKRNCRHRSDSEDHLLPRCAERDRRSTEAPPPAPTDVQPRSPPFSSTSFEEQQDAARGAMPNDNVGSPDTGSRILRIQRFRLDSLRLRGEVRFF